jgi:hypothetical protein
MLSEKYAIKLFPQIWDPEMAQLAEVESYAAITSFHLEGERFLPSLLHHGYIEFVCCSLSPLIAQARIDCGENYSETQSPKLRYLVLSLVPGRSLSKVLHKLQDSEFDALVKTLCLITSEVHVKSLSTAGLSSTIQLVDLVEEQIRKFNKYVLKRINKAEKKQTKWGHLPSHLVLQVGLRLNYDKLVVHPPDFVRLTHFYPK